MITVFFQRNVITVAQIHAEDQLEQEQVGAFGTSPEQLVTEMEEVPKAPISSTPAVERGPLPASSPREGEFLPPQSEVNTQLRSFL